MGAVSVVFLAGCGTTRSLVDRALHPFSGGTVEAVAAYEQKGVSRVRTKDLAMQVEASTLAPKLSEARRVEITVRLENISRKFVQLEFPTAQRVDAVLSDDKGNVIARWSDDHMFEQAVSYVGINPGEHVQYAVFVPTRDMDAGKKYTLLTLFPHFPELKVEQHLTPLP